MSKENSLARRDPTLTRNFLHGVSVSVRSAHAPHLTVANMGVTSGVGFTGGFITMLASAPNEWIWNSGTETGVALMAAATLPWVGYGAAKGARGVVRHFAAVGAADHEKSGLMER